MNCLENKKLYLIVDTSYIAPEEALCVTKELCGSGADIIQFRDKILSDKEKYDISLKMHDITLKYNVPLIINDRLDIAMAVNAEGVHLGQDDLPIIKARQILNLARQKMIIGISTHSYQQAIEADRLPVDYIAVGPLFPTQTKPDYTPIGLEQAGNAAKAITGKPVFGIGNINKDTIRDVLNAGLKRIVVVSAVLKSNNKREIIGFFKNFL